MASPGISIQVDPAQFARATELLDPKALRKAMRSAVQATTSGGKTLVRREVQKVLNAKTASLNEAITARVTKDEPPQGKITISKKPIPLYDIKGAKAAKRGGIIAKVLKNKPPLHFKHGYAATVGRGNHIGFFSNQIRKPKHIPPHGRYAGRTIKRGPRKGQPLLRRPIEELMATTIYQVVNVPEVIQKITAQLADDLVKKFESKITWQLSLKNK